MRFASRLLALGLLLNSACFEDTKSSDTGGTGSGSDTETDGGTGATTVGATTGSTGVATDSGGGTTADPDLCEDYCTLVADTCEGEHQQYSSSAVCDAICAVMEPGRPGVLGDTAECRKNQAVQATENPETFCLPAGPTGGGVCGAQCQAFCTLAASLCTGDLAQWTDTPSCIADCMQFPDDVVYNSSITSGDSFACRIYHLTVASLDPGVHCPHIGLVSPVCL